MMTKNTSEQLFGTLKEGKEKGYSGSESNTVVITVNNDTKTIRAEVIVKNILGDNSDQAYPGNLGAVAYSNAYQARQIAEKTRAETFENDTYILNIVQTMQQTYASKQYVQEQIVSSTTLSKQIVDYVDLERNLISIDGVEKTPVDGVLYLVEETYSEGGTNYQQYTTIEGQLTLIGNTTINLADYAKIDYVDEQIAKIDLSPYATKSEIPDVSNFITEIPSDYATEDEVTDYVTDKLFDYATKSYVQSELSKVGTFTKLIVDSVDTENNTYTKDGVTSNTVQDVIYLVPYVENDETVHQQYTMIDDKLSYIGSTKVDLKGYATVDYVNGRVSATELKLNTNINKTKNDLEEMILNIKFIDGGNAPAPN